jgi:hypothetical protein
MKLKNTYIGCLMLGWIFAFSAPSFSQYLPTHISNEGIYLFLDELATEKVIDLHSLVKPYGRKEIAEQLIAADSSRSVLTGRQQAELDFYLGDYMKELPISDVSEYGNSWLWLGKSDKRFDVFHYRDSLFQMTVNPILGGDVWSNANGSFYHWWNGVEATSTIGKFGIWASLRDNHESTELTARDFQNDRIGGANIKRFSDGKRDYWELRAGITYGWDWGHVGLIMGQFAWGENNAGANIFSGRTPAFPRLELAMDPAPWFRFTYVHGALISEVVDSSLSFTTSSAYGTDFREVFHSKYMAANIFTFVPTSGLQLSVGNSVIYDYRHPHAAFLLPVAFYKAIDHTLNSYIENMNSQLFLSFSSRNLKNLHFYGSVFLDEVAADNLYDKEEDNFVSYKVGVSSNFIRNTKIWGEYLWTNVLTFMHYVPTTTFESNQYNLGHYLEDNARQLYVGAEFRPIRTLNIRAWYAHSEKGPDHTALGTMPRDGIAPFDPIVWESVSAGILATYQVVNDLYVRLGYERRNVSGQPGYLNLWTPDEYHGKTGTLRLGLNYGF